MPVQIFSSSRIDFKQAQVKKSLEALLRYLKFDKAVLEVQFVGLQSIRKLNHQFLKKDKVTDVLSFPLDLKPISSEAPWILGEIVIAVSVARDQAKNADRTLTAQIVRLAIHGLVHLQGYDHEKAGERKAFEALEERYLRYLDRKGILKWNGFLPLSAEFSRD